MFKLHRQNNGSSPKSGERVDFKFSNFQALQVPKGWDRLFLSVISVESGKTIAKLGKATVRNGNCQWTETLLESVWISKEDSSHELEECLFKFVVSMGSSRAGILGEAIINFSSFMSTRLSSPVLCPLAKCSYGTVFQVKIQCLTLMSPIRKENLNHSGLNEKNQAVNYHDTGHNPNRSDDTFANGAKTSPSQRGYDSKESSYSESISSKASKSPDGSVRRVLNSDHSLHSDGFSPHQRHSVVTPKGTSPLPHHPIGRHSLSSQSSSNSEEMSPRMELQSSGKESSPASLRNAGSVNLLEAAEGTIDELRAEAKMWERNARKLMIDLELLRKEFLDQSKKQADVVMELSASYTEQDALKKEIANLKLTLEEVTVKQRTLENSSFQYGSHNHIQKELESEIKFHNETNANLALQLKRSQESNIELLSVLQELEETIEQQKVEMENIKGQLKYTQVDVSTEQDLYESKNLLLQLQQVQESEKTLQMRVQFLEKASQSRTDELEKEPELSRISQSVDTIQNNGSDVDLIRELESLREKVEELERDCNELTDENLELVLKLKDLKNNQVEKCSSFSSTSSELPSKSASALSELSDHEPVYDLELKRKLNYAETSEFLHKVLKQIEVALQHLMKSLFDTSSDVTEKCKYLLADLVNIRRKDTITYDTKLLTESTVKCFIELNKILEDRFAEYEWGVKYDELETQRRDATILEAEKRLKDQIQKIEEQEHSKAKVEADYSNLLNKFTQQKNKIDELQAILLRKEGEINYLSLRQEQLEDQISDLERQKGLMEENSIIVQGESNISAKCLNELRNELEILSSSLESHVSAKKILDKQVSDLEMEKHQLENKQINLERDLLKSQEHISDLDFQLRQLKEEYESCQMELQNSESHSMNLQVQISDMQIEKTNFTKELKDKQDQLLAAQTEFELVKTENQDFEASNLRLSEECRILQRLNKELKIKETELHKLEDKFEESQESLFACSQKVEYLEKNLALMVEDFTLKEKSMTSELEALLQENKKEKEKLIEQESLSSKLHLEMSSDVNNLQIEVECLTKQIFAAREENEKLKSETSIELSSLQVDKAESESDLQKLQSKVEHAERELNTLRSEKELEIHSLITQLDASKQNHALLTSEHEKLLKQLGSYRKIEEKLKTAVNDLELKLTVSDYENQQLREENTNKKIHVQITSDLQNEISNLKSKIDECKSEKDKLEDSLRRICADYENLKAEKDSCVEKIKSLQESILEHERCKQKQAFLEEKLLKLEGALLIKEANCDPRLMEKNAEDGSHFAVHQVRKNELKKEPTDNMHKPHLPRLSSEDEDSRITKSKDQPKDTNLATQEIFQRSKSSLETELRDLRERYLQMSLKYAEVEGEREDLVMKLKAAKGGRHWF